MAQTTSSTLGKVDSTKKLDKFKSTTGHDFVLSQHEALRRATLLKHRKVSTQLKLDMVQRQLSDIHRAVPDGENKRQFYRLQMTELSNELQDLGATLEKVERNAFYARRRMLRHCGMDISNSAPGIIPLSASHPAIYSSSETLDQCSARGGLKTKVCHLMSSPSGKFRKKHFLGELRAVASLSNLNIKSTSHTSFEDGIHSKDSKLWKGPLKFLGHFVDSRIKRKLWGSAKRTKSVDNIVDDKKPRRLSDAGAKDCNGFRVSEPEVFTSSSSSSESSDEDEEVEEVEWTAKPASKHIWKGPVVRKVSSSQRAQIDPAILAEIEDFEKMAAQYIKHHS